MHLEPERQLVGPAGFTRTLLSSSQRAPVSLPLTREEVPGGAPRMRWIADALKKDAIGWACRQGGWRERQVVAAGRRREGRLWDAKIFPHLGVRFTPGPMFLLSEAMESTDSLPELAPGLAAQIAAGLEGEDPATGDLLALHRIVSALFESTRRVGARGREPQRPRCPSCGEALPQPARPAKRPKTKAGGRRARKERCPNCNQVLNHADFAVPPTSARRATEAVRARALLELSPLTCAYQPQRAGSLEASGSDDAAGAHAQRLAPLFRGDRAVLLTYLDDSLAQAWLGQEEERRKMPVQEALASYQNTTATLEGYVRAAIDRPDALRPLVRFFEAYVVRRFGGRAPVGEALRQQAQGFNRASEREQFLRAAARLFGLGRSVRAAVERALAAPYVDRTESEKVLLADYHELFRDVGPEVEAIRRELAGEIG